MKKRVLSLFLTLMLCTASLPTTVLAEELDGTNSTAAVETVDSESVPEETGVEDAAEGGKIDTGNEEEAKDKSGEIGTGNEAEAEGDSGETNAGSTTDESVASVQGQIDSLPNAEELPAMDADELNTAYMAIQTAYDAYDALTEEQQAQIIGADCFEKLFSWFNGQVAPLDGYITIEFGAVNEKTGEIEPKSFQRTGCKTVDESTTVLAGADYYVLNGNVTLSSLTVQGGLTSNAPSLFLGKNTTLTIDGSLIFQSGIQLFVYGPADGSGKIIINNTSADAAAIRAEGASNGSYLAVYSGELEITSESGRITEGVSLLNGSNNFHYMEYEIDGKSIGYEENRNMLQKDTIVGKYLTLAPCDHKDEYVTYVSSDSTHHEMKCAQCGFVGTAVACEFNSPNGYDPGDANGHYATCICGNVDKTQQTQHTMVTQPTLDGKMHTSACRECGYVADGAEMQEHVWDTVKGECTVCDFMPVARDSQGNLYDSVTDALKAAADGNGAEYVELYSKKTDDKELHEAVEYDHVGATVTLRMNGYTLNENSSPALSVENGTLIIAGDATVKSWGSSQETANSAVVVSGGKLIFEDKLTAEGSVWSGMHKPAVTASSGELEFKGDLDLNGGLQLTGNAKLTNGLKQGTLWAEGDDSVTRVSVDGSGVYRNVYGLLADGYAFAEKANPEILVNANPTTLKQDVTIVEHIEAVVDSKAYSDVETAINDWLASGRKLTLHADCGISGATWSGVGERTLDLNGYKLTGGKPDLASGIDLTIQDSSEYGTGQIGSLKVNKGAKLTMEGGYILSLNVEDAADGDVKLRGGCVVFETISVPSYKMLESGYCLMNGNLTVNPADEKLSTGTFYRVKKAAVTVGGEKSGEIVIGGNRVPIEVFLSVDKSIESDVARVQLQWYLVKDDGVVQLATSKDVWLSDDGSVSYKPNAADSIEYAEAWKNLEVEKTYNLICTVTGKKSDGAYRWQTVLKDYQMKITKADLNSEETVITQKENSGNTGNPADNRLVVKPNVEFQSLDDVTYQFDVTYNGTLLTPGTDYTVKGNSDTAQNAGEHELTIVGIGNYTGEKTVRWTIEPYELSGEHVSTQICKEYDGTNTADENVQGVSILGCFEIDSSNRRNPVVKGAQINLYNSVTRANLHFDSAEAGSRTFGFTLTLKDNNYVFADGTKTASFELSRKKPGDPLVSISKKVSAAPEAKNLYVVNGYAATYTVDLAEMLPELDSPMKYGSVQYQMDSVILESDYYTTDNTASIKDGLLTLPILTSQRTGNVDVGTVTVKVTSDNVTDITLTIHVKAADRIVPTLNGELNLSRTELTYGDQLSAISISGTMTDPTTHETVKGTLAWETPDQTMDRAGTYDATWKFVPDNAAVYTEVTGKVTITVSKATLIGEPKYTVITDDGKKLSDAALTANDKWPAGTLKWMDAADNMLSDDTEVKANTIYQWCFIPTNTNYNALSGKVELYHVDAPAISAQPESVSVITGEKAAFKVTATGTNVTYQWKIDRNDGKGFVDITGATDASYTTGVTDKDCDGFKYQCVISNAAGSVTTDTVILTVREKFIITVTAGEHGSISPNGAVEVVEGSKQTFVITAEEGYEIADLTVDGTAVKAAASYTFENVTAAHTIAVTFKLQYKIIDGVNSSWTQNTDGNGSIRIRGNGEFSQFLNVKVDGTIVDPANYTASEGSTIIELKADYLKTLSEGSHTFEIAWKDGTASTSFTVAKNTSGNDDNDSDNDSDNNSSNNNGGNNIASSNNTVSNTAQTQTRSPNTGDASGIWLTLFVVSLAGLAGMLMLRRKTDRK